MNLEINKLPVELRYKILLCTDLETCIKTGNKYCIDKMYNPEIHTWDYAARYGNLTILKWLFNNKKEYFSKDTILRAIDGEHLETVKWLFINTFNDYFFNDIRIKIRTINIALTYASGCIKPDIMEWLYLNTNLKTERILYTHKLDELGICFHHDLKNMRTNYPLTHRHLKDVSWKPLCERINKRKII